MYARNLENYYLQVLIQVDNYSQLQVEVSANVLEAAHGAGCLGSELTIAQILRSMIERVQPCKLSICTR